MPVHYCQRVPSEPNTLRLSSIEDEPGVCGKIAHFTYRHSDLFNDNMGNRIWHVCAECYDFIVSLHGQ